MILIMVCIQSFESLNTQTIRLYDSDIWDESARQPGYPEAKYCDHDGDDKIDADATAIDMNTSQAKTSCS